MIGLRLLGIAACLSIPFAADADLVADDVSERIAAHFEAASSRLRPEDADPLERFVARVRNTPGARLAVLVPITREPARARFVAARVNELERRVQTLAETAEYRRISANSNADILWLALVPAPRSEGEGRHQGADASPQSIPSALPGGPLALTAPAVFPPEAKAVTPADLRLNGWVVRGVKHRADGPASAYIARTAPGAVPREIAEHQTDPDLGLIREIALSPDIGWVVRTEIGWIGQSGPSGGS